MKKLTLALAAAAALTASGAMAADMAVKARPAPPPVAYAPSWTGCYVGGGWGYGLWNQENTSIDTFTGVPFSNEVTHGGRGWLGTVQGGCDYQFPVGTYNLVVGAFADYDFASLKGDVSIPAFGFFNDAVGQEKMSSAWSVGARIGWLVTPNLLTYFSGGYTEATFDRTNFTFFGNTTPTFFIDKRTYKGWFIGGGDEYALGFLPGLFWKTEYRFSEFNRARNDVRDFFDGDFIGTSISSKKFVQTIRSELTYHFNWGGPAVAARY